MALFFTEQLLSLRFNLNCDRSVIRWTIIIEYNMPYKSTNAGYIGSERWEAVPLANRCQLL